MLSIITANGNWSSSGVSPWATTAAVGLGAATGEGLGDGAASPGLGDGERETAAGLGFGACTAGASLAALVGAAGAGSPWQAVTSANSAPARSTTSGALPPKRW